MQKHKVLYEGQRNSVRSNNVMVAKLASWPIFAYI